jgi:hypothetical protein
VASALSATAGWSVGQEQKDNGSILSLTEQFNWSKWAVVSSPDPGMPGKLVDNSLSSVASAANTGTGGSRTDSSDCDRSWPNRPRTQKKSPRFAQGLFIFRNPGDVLLSQGVAPQVPSALTVLTSVFGMGTGVAPSLWSPETCSRSPGSFSEPGRGRPVAVLERPIASTSKVPSPRPISTGRLNTLPCLHLRPINVVVWPRALPGLPCGRPNLGTSFALRCFQRLSHP